MSDWRLPQRRNPPPQDPYELERQSPPQQVPPQRGGFDESQLPPSLQKYHRGQRPPLSEKLQDRREEFREYYNPQGVPQGQYIPEPPPRKSRVPLLLTAVSVSLVLLGVIIAAINIAFVRNPGQTIQSLTMIHAEIIVVLVAILINTLLTERKK